MAPISAAPPTLGSPWLLGFWKAVTEVCGRFMKTRSGSSLEAFSELLEVFAHQAPVFSSGIGRSQKGERVSVGFLVKMKYLLTFII